jgi:hypothetical protein
MGSGTAAGLELHSKMDMKAIYPLPDGSNDVLCVTFDVRQ